MFLVDLDALLGKIVEYSHAHETSIAVTLWVIVFLIIALNLKKRKHSISGEVALVTGGGMGIGREMVLNFASQGCHIVIWDIQTENAEIVAEEVRTKYPRCLVWVVNCDVSSKTDVHAAALTTRELVGRDGVDILVNNAGIVSGKLLTELTETDVRRTMGVNSFAHFWTVQEFLPGMLARRHGHIVTIASVMGLIGSAGLTDYCASKFAAVGFAHSLRYELQKLTGGTVTSTLVCPYAINTGMFRGISLSLQFLFPMLEQEYVGRRIVEAVQRREDVLVMPAMVALSMKLLPPLPQWLQDVVAMRTGAISGMDTFRGRRRG